MLPRLLHCTATTVRCTITGRPAGIVPGLLRCGVLAVARGYASYPGTPVGNLKKTPLHDLHVAAGAKMVAFAGYSMPVTYPDQGLGESHSHVRTKAGLFDVSHMVQHRFSGPGTLQFLQTVTPSDLLQLPRYHSTLSVFLHPITGGIVDDLMVTSLGPEDFYVVTNAACAEKDAAYIAENLAEFRKAHGTAKDVSHVVLAGQGLLALQGPEARLVMQEYLVRALAGNDIVDLDKIYFGSVFSVCTLEHGDIQIARGGYTGEDGFEISVAAGKTEAFTKMLLDIGRRGDIVKLTGLGARDSLRLEAGMCLYGHDLGDTTTPIEAGLKWVVGKQRVLEGGFLGAETIIRQYSDLSLVARRRVGLVVEGAPAREGAEIFSMNGEQIGRITSGCPSPTLAKNIAMGYVKSGFHKLHTEVGVKVRGKVRRGVITRMPFVPAKYWKGPKGAPPA